MGLVVLAVFLAAPSVVSGSVLADVPTQGSMIHVSIRFRNTSPKGLSVNVDPTVAKLIPLSISDPGDGFDPDDPWYDVLKEQAFNRAYGWLMSANSDPLPNSNYAIWIRRVSVSPGLAIYRYRRQPSALFEPMLGTDQSSSVWSWNMTMFHPCFVAPSGSEALSATLEAFVADTRTGSPVNGYASAVFTLEFDPVPELRIHLFQTDGMDHVLGWTIPYPSRSYQLLWRTNLGAPFLPVSGIRKSSQNVFTNHLSAPAPASFYRVIMK